MNPRHFPRGQAAVVVVLVLALAAGGIAWWTWGRAAAPSPSSAPDEATNLVLMPGTVNAAGRMQLAVTNNDPRDLESAVVLLRPAAGETQVETRIARLAAGGSSTYDVQLPGEFIGKPCQAEVRTASFSTRPVAPAATAVPTPAATPQPLAAPTARNQAAAQPTADAADGPEPLTAEETARRNTIRTAIALVRQHTRLPADASFAAWNGPAYIIETTIAGTLVSGTARKPLMLGGHSDVPFVVEFDPNGKVLFVEFEGLVEVDVRK